MTEPLSLSSVRMICSKIQEITGAGEDVEQMEPLCTLGRNENCTAIMENTKGIFQKIKNRTTIRSTNTTSRYYAKEIKTHSMTPPLP